MINQENHPTILLIEDNDDHAEITQFYIQDHVEDINVVRLKDGKEAIDYIDDLCQQAGMNYPWLILLDLKIPKFDGHEILVRLKSEQTLISIPVVIFTTSNSNKDIEMALKAGANSYIQKPTEPEDFVATIANIIDYWTIDQHDRVIDVLNHYG